MTDEVMGEVMVLALCESVHLFLKPNVLYRFEVVDGCAACLRLEALSLGETVVTSEEKA